MADNKKPHYLEDDTLYALRTKNQEDWSEFGELAQEQYSNFMKWWNGTGEEATSFRSSTRGCIRCAGSLKIIEETENGYLLLECASCGMQQWESDIAPDSKEKQKQFTQEANAYGAEYRHLPDENYRSIPQHLINQYMVMRERKLAKQGL